MKNVLITLALAALTSAATPGLSFAQTAEDFPARVTDFAVTEAPDDHAVGSDDAAITMIAWASVTCSHCGNWFSTEWPAIKSELIETGKLRFVFREMATAPSEISMPGFLFAECAPSEDYMTVIEYQMENQRETFKAAQAGQGREAMMKIAKLAGMSDDDSIAACLRNPDMVAHIEDNWKRAKAADAKGTLPIIFINGQGYNGAKDAENLVKLIEDMDTRGLSLLPKGIAAAKPHDGHNHD